MEKCPSLDHAEETLIPTKRELLRLLRIKHGPLSAFRWRPRSRVRLRRRFGYFTPNDYYEALVAKLVTSGISWLDVGCGRDLFPDNPRLARILADRCTFLQGVDPDDTINENALLHARAKEPIDTFRTDRVFDLVTLRMVAEHPAEPEKTVRNLAGLTGPGGKVVVFTPNRWSLVSLAALLTPFPLHHPIKRFLWNAEEKDTFPVVYRLNIRRCLSELFCANGFRTALFRYLPACTTFAEFYPVQVLELSCWKVLGALGWRYPENNLLGVFERTP